MGMSRANFLVEREDVVSYIRRRANGMKVEQDYRTYNLLTDVAREIEDGLHAQGRQREAHRQQN